MAAAGQQLDAAGVKGKRDLAPGLDGIQVIGVLGLSRSRRATIRAGSLTAPVRY
jgi:hypothetical protein